MGDWPATSGAHISSVGANSAASTGTTVTAAGTANIKGAWTELVASTPCSAGAIVISVNPDANITSYLLDIGVGASGFETVLIPDMHLSARADFAGNTAYPLAIPAGSRIVARVATDVAGRVLNVAAQIIGNRFDGPVGRNQVRTYGAVIADTGGTSIDPGPTAHTKGQWVEVTPSTSVAHQGLIIDLGLQSNGTTSAIRWLFDVGVGPSTAERILIPDYRVVSSLSESLHPVWSPMFPVSIPGGSRLAVRSQSTEIDAVDRLLDVVLHGIN